MHPEVRTEDVGKCLICDMTLEQEKSAEEAANQVRSVSEIKLKWILFTAMALTVPMFLFLVQEVTLMPLGASFSLVLILLPLTLPQAGLQAFLYYKLAGFLAKWLARLSPERQVWGLLLMVMSLVILAMFPIYGGGGHGNNSSFNIFGAYKYLFNPWSN